MVVRAYGHVVWLAAKESCLFDGRLLPVSSLRLPHNAKETAVTVNKVEAVSGRSIIKFPRWDPGVEISRHRPLGIRWSKLQVRLLHSEWFTV